MEEFATPNDVADQMVEALFEGESPSPDARVLIPGCGSGSLLGAVERYCERHSVDLPEIVAIEIDADRLAAAKSGHKQSTITYLHRDFLSDPSDLGQFDYVLANPPVIQWKDIDPKRRESYRYRFTTITDAGSHQAQMHVLFFEQALRLLTEAGRLVFIVPDDFATPSATPSPLAELLGEYGVERLESMPVAIADAPVSPVMAVVSQAHQPAHKKRQIDWKTAIDELLHTHEISVREVMTSEPVTYAPNDDISRVFFNLIREDYDVIPVIEDGTCVGYVSRGSINRTDTGDVSEHMNERVDPTFISPAASFDDLLDHLSIRRFAFVGDTQHLEGLVTRFDLNRPPVYFHLYSKIAQLEVGLREACRAGEVDIEEHLDYSHIRQIKTNYRRYRNVVPDMFACAQLSQLIKLVESANLTDSIGVAQETPDDVDLWDLNTLRVNIAHYYPIIHTLDDVSSDDAQRTAYDLLLANKLLDEYIASL